ncbi:hypothetical protein [Acidocella sp.]|nr:hypothetical protein [Acidocella sp.]
MEFFALHPGLGPFPATFVAYLLGHYDILAPGPVIFLRIALLSFGA